MNQISKEREKIIVMELSSGKSVRVVAREASCTPSTVRRYARLHVIERPSISEAVRRWHEFRRQGYVNPQQVMAQRMRREREKLEGVPQCRGGRKKCVNCREIFGVNCKIRVGS